MLKSWAVLKERSRFIYWFFHLARALICHTRLLCYHVERLHPNKTNTERNGTAYENPPLSLSLFPRLTLLFLHNSR